MVAQFPETEAEIDSLFSRDLPRLEGLKKDDVYSLIASLTSVVNDMQYEHSLQKNNIKRLVLGCCTQAVLAQVLNFLLVEERTYVKEKRPDLMKREDSGFSLFGVRLFGDQHASKAGARISDKDDTLLLHSFLQARINNDDFSILYNLEWNVVSTERPEVCASSFILPFASMIVYGASVGNNWTMECGLQSKFSSHSRGDSNHGGSDRCERRICITLLI